MPRSERGRKEAAIAQSAENVVEVEENAGLKMRSIRTTSPHEGD